WSSDVCSSDLRVSATELDGLLSTNLDFCRYLQEMQAREVHAHLELMIDVVSRTAQYRLAKLLFDAFVIRDMHSGTDRSLPIPLKQWEIAELLAVTPEHTSRVLRRLEKEGLISRKRNILSFSTPKDWLRFSTGHGLFGPTTHLAP